MGLIPEISFDGPQWFCIMAEPGREDRAICDLAAYGYRAFTPKLRKWVSHARVRKAVERPLIGRYVFVEVDYPRQSFSAVEAANGVAGIVSLAGIPCMIPRDDVEDLLRRYLVGEFDEVANAAIPIGARVAIVEGKFGNWLATVTGRQRGGFVTLKVLGQNVHINRVPVREVRPAYGFDLARVNTGELI